MKSISHDRFILAYKVLSSAFYAIWTLMKSISHDRSILAYKVLSSELRDLY